MSRDTEGAEEEIRITSHDNASARKNYLKIIKQWFGGEGMEGQLFADVIFFAQVLGI
jgi:hypothetical protein